MAKIEPIRLQKFIAQCGIASRRKAEELILGGHVKVNGKTAILGDKVLPTDKVFVRARELLYRRVVITNILCSTSPVDSLPQ